MEQDRKDHIKDVFSTRLKNLEQEPPAFIWDRIEEQLPLQEASLPIQPKKRSLIPQYLIWGVGVAAAMLFGLFLFKNINDQNTGNLIGDLGQQELFSHKLFEREDKNGHNLNDVQSETSSSFYATKLAAPSKSVSKLNLDSSSTQRVNNTSPVDQNQNKTVNEMKDGILLTDNNKEHDKKDTDPNQNNQNGDNDNAKVLKDIQKQIDDFEAEGRKADILLADNNDQNVSSGGDFTLAFAGGGALSKADSYKRTVRPVANSDQQITLRSETVKLEHNQPIVFGLTLNKRINKHFSIESGINYSYLSSKVKSSSASLYSQNDMQYFHYVGVPLNLNYNFVEWKKLKIYLSAGGTVQKDIYGRLDRYRLTNNVGGTGTSQKNKKNISQKNIQMSVNTSFGLSYPLYNNISVYTTVGGAYYFDAKNEYETIYSDKKWLLNLNLGLKFDF